MAGDHRTRRLGDGTSRGQRTLDPPSEAPEAPVDPPAVEPPDLLEFPPAPRPSARLEERQRQWLVLRELAIAREAQRAARTAEPAEEGAADPKG